MEEKTIGYLEKFCIYVNLLPSLWYSRYAYIYTHTDINDVSIKISEVVSSLEAY
jgi:hypothetical protein